ncbi:serine hydrolase [Arsenicicoccus dermatophilus]|uniref:serine hydrolase n=1 Tax=Arsenicicoccus dermatophilus TaxID=1076331 RepID=UPI001F4CCFCD|nr:serine hydrolase [Arsenicicoccus dermatophilus]MCH8612201.1 class A beta-lactamase-related serine hydrolase [Arsenicicoccus dermatophilus]
MPTLPLLRRLAPVLVAPLLLGSAACGDVSSRGALPAETVTAPSVTHTRLPDGKVVGPGGKPVAPPTTTPPVVPSSPPTPATPPTPAPGATTTTPAAPTSSRPAVTRATFDQVAFDYLEERKGVYGFVASDLTTGQTVEHHPEQRCQTASLVKLDVLLTLLLRRQDDGGPSSSERALARRMIVSSDNEATTKLWGIVGADAGVRRANKTFGLTETEPGARWTWGMTTTTAPDQIRLLRNLVKDGPLTRESRDYALGLMSDVEEYQAWGISAANPKREAALKNGWLPIDEGWVVTSAGRVRTAGGHDVLMAAVSCHGRSQEHSVESIEHLASLAATALDQK